MKDFTIPWILKLKTHLKQFNTRWISKTQLSGFDDSMNNQNENSIDRVEYSKNVEDSIEKVTRLK